MILWTTDPKILVFAVGQKISLLSSSVSVSRRSFRDPGEEQQQPLWRCNLTAASTAITAPAAAAATAASAASAANVPPLFLAWRGWFFVFFASKTMGGFWTRGGKAKWYFWKGIENGVGNFWIHRELGWSYSRTKNETLLVPLRVGWAKRVILSLLRQKQIQKDDMVWP